MGAAAGLFVGGVIVIAATRHAYNMATNPSYRRSAQSFNQVISSSAIQAVEDVTDFVGSLFSSGEATADENTPSTGEQAGEISNEIGKNSVTLPDGTRVDLKGRGHRAESGKKIETPHTHEVETNTNPKTGETFTKTKKIPRPTTQEDLDEVKEIIKNQQGN